MIPARCPPVVAPAPGEHKWTFGEPESSPGRFSWIFVPLVRCALGLDEHGGMVQVMAGDKLWVELRDHYAAEFTRSGVTVDSLPFDRNGYLDRSHQVRVLLGSLAGGESNIADEIEGKLTAFASKLQRLWQQRSRPRPPRANSASSSSEGKHSGPAPESGNTLPRIPPRPDQAEQDDSITDPPRPHLSTEGDRLSVSDIAEHGRLWNYILPGCEDYWLAAARPRFKAFADAHHANNARDRGIAIDRILALPATSLVRKRGGRRRAARTIRRRLRTVAASRLDSFVPGTLSPRSNIGSPETPPVDSARAARSELELWKAKVRRAVKRGRAGKIKKCVDVLTQDGMADWNEERIQQMREKHPRATNVVPPCPSSAPHTIFDPKETAKLVLQLANWTAAGPSGWTAELLLPLLEDESCLDAITLLAQLIANNELDDHSRRLLTSSVLHAIPKSDGGLRPLALGELFVKLACKYCLIC